MGKKMVGAFRDVADPSLMGGGYNPRSAERVPGYRQGSSTIARDVSRADPWEQDRFGVQWEPKAYGRYAGSRQRGYVPRSDSDPVLTSGMDDETGKVWLPVTRAQRIKKWWWKLDKALEDLDKARNKLELLGQDPESVAETMDDAGYRSAREYGYRDPDSDDYESAPPTTLPGMPSIGRIVGGRFGGGRVAVRRPPVRRGGGGGYGYGGYGGFYPVPVAVPVGVEEDYDEDYDDEDEG